MTLTTAAGFALGLLVAHLIWSAAETIAAWKDRP